VKKPKYLSETEDLHQQRLSEVVLHTRLPDKEPIPKNGNRRWRPRRLRAPVVDVEILFIQPGPALKPVAAWNHSTTYRWDSVT
jgi:hypothetical protein